MLRKRRLREFFVAPMISDKVELIVGTSLDPLFGPVLMLGLGGVFAEALAATAHRLCPINAREARDMIEEVRGLPQILAGFRGAPKADIDALVGVLVRVSEFAIAAKAEIASLDINPLGDSSPRSRRRRPRCVADPAIAAARDRGRPA